MTKEKTKVVLNQAVADLSQLSALIHQTHWYMRGANFLKLHPLMDEYRDAIESQLDEMSERLITIGGAPYSTLEEFAQNSKIELKPTTYDVSTPDRFKALIKAFRYVADDLYQEGLDVTDEEGDDVTNDIFVGGKAWLEKTIWMLQAELDEAPGI